MEGGGGEKQEDGRVAKMSKYSTNTSMDGKGMKRVMMT